MSFKFNFFESVADQSENGTENQTAESMKEDVLKRAFKDNGI